MSVDLRELGCELEFFATTPIVGAGLPLWLPDGAIIRSEVEKFAAEQAARSGCRGVYTPVMAKKELYERSGHWSKFSDDMFPEMKIGGESFLLRPANCPHRAQVFAARGRSYRELPFRVRELGSMFRSELSGVLSGLNRVRQINLERCYSTLGIAERKYRLSIRGERDSTSAPTSSGRTPRINFAEHRMHARSSTWKQRGRQRSTVPRSTSKYETRTAARKHSRPRNSTSTNRSGSNSGTPPRTDPRLAPS